MMGVACVRLCLMSFKWRERAFWQESKHKKSLPKERIKRMPQVSYVTYIPEIIQNRGRGGMDTKK